MHSLVESSTFSPPSSLDKTAIEQLKKVSEQLLRQETSLQDRLSSRSICYDRVGAIEQLLKRSPELVSSMKKLAGHIEQLKGYPPQEEAIERFVLSYLMRGPLNEVEVYVAKANFGQYPRRSVIQYGKNLLEKGDYFLLGELFSRLHSEIAIRCLLRKGPEDQSLQSLIYEKCEANTAKQIVQPVKWDTKKPSYRRLGILFSERLVSSELEEADLLLRTAGMEGLIKALRCKDQKQRTPLMHCIQKNSLKGIEWIEEKVKQATCREWLLKVKEAPYSSSKRPWIWCLKQSSRSTAEWIARIISDKELKRQLSSTEPEGIRPCLDILVECSLEVADWLCELIGREQLVAWMQEQKELFLQSLLLHSNTDKAGWVVQQIGKETFCEWLMGTEQSGSLLTHLYYSKMELLEPNFSWMAQQLTPEELSQQLQSQGNRLLLHSLLGKQLNKVDWIVKRLSKPQLLDQLNATDDRGRTPLMACIAEGLVKSATHLVAWLEANAPLVIHQQLTKENQAGETPLLELFYKESSDSALLLKTAIAVRGWLLPNLWSEQLQKKPLLVHFFKKKDLVMASWVKEQIGNELAQQQLTSFFADALPYPITATPLFNQGESAIHQFKWLKKWMDFAAIAEQLKQQDGEGYSPLLRALMAGDLPTARWMARQLAPNTVAQQLQNHGQGCLALLDRALSSERYDIADWIAKKVGQALASYLLSTMENGYPLLGRYLIHSKDSPKDSSACKKCAGSYWILKQLKGSDAKKLFTTQYVEETLLVLALKNNQAKAAQWIAQFLSPEELKQQLSKAEKESGNPLLVWLTLHYHHAAARWVACWERDLKEKAREGVGK